MREASSTTPKPIPDDSDECGITITVLCKKPFSLLALADSGCTHSLISKQMALKISKVFRSKIVLEITCADLGTISSIGELTIKIKIYTKVVQHKFYVMEKLPYPCFFGIPSKP